MKKTVELSIILAIALVGSGCATISNSEKDVVVVTSEPSDAEVFVSNRSRGHTPVDIPLDIQDNSGSTIRIQKDGYREETDRLTTSIESSYIFWDAVLGVWPLLIDSVTEDWKEFDKSKYHFNLKKNVSYDRTNVPEDKMTNKESNKSDGKRVKEKDKKDETKSNDDKIESVFGEESKNNENNSNEDKSKKNNYTNLKVKNSAYSNHGKYKKMLKKLNRVSVVSEKFKEGKSIFEIKTERNVKEIVDKMLKKFGNLSVVLLDPDKGEVELEGDG